MSSSRLGSVRRCRRWSRSRIRCPRTRALAEVAAALQATRATGAGSSTTAGGGAYVTDELRLTFGGNSELSRLRSERTSSVPSSLPRASSWRFGSNTTESHLRSTFARPRPVACSPTRRAGATRCASSSTRRCGTWSTTFAPADPAGAVVRWAGNGPGRRGQFPIIGFRIRDRDGRLAGTAIITKPAAGMATLGSMTSMGDPRHYRADAAGRRRPAGDPPRSCSPTWRLVPARSASLDRELLRPGSPPGPRVDQCIIDAGACPAGTSVTVSSRSFSPRPSGSESAAARACITAARALRAAVREVAARSDLRRRTMSSLRFGLHWGSTLYVGNITTGGRTEVTALGDEVNEAARIEACATGGRALASKSLSNVSTRRRRRARARSRPRHLHAARGPRHGDRQGAPRRPRYRSLRRGRIGRSARPSGLAVRCSTNAASANLSQVGSSSWSGSAGCRARYLVVARETGYWRMTVRGRSDRALKLNECA